MNLRETIDNSPMSLYQWAIVAMATILNILDGFDVLALAFTASAIKTEFQLSGIQLGYLFSIGLFGMTISSLFIAPFADKIGRRPLLLIAIVLSAVGMFGSAFISQYETLGFWRFVTGLGVGSILVCTNVLTSEYASRKWRSLAISIYAAGFGIGAMLGGIFSTALLADYGWRSVYLVGAGLTALCFFIFLFWLPESLDFLMNKQPKDAQKRLFKIAQKMGFEVNLSEDSIKQALKDNIAQSSITQSSITQSSIIQLFNQHYLRSTLLIWFAFFFIMFSFYFINSWTPVLLKEAGMTMNESIHIGIMISLGGTLGSIIYGLLASQWFAKKVLVLFTILSSLAVIFFIFSTNTLWLAMLLAVIIGALINGCVSGLYTINPSIYAADVRSTGVGWSIGIGRIGSIIAPMVAGSLLDDGWEKQHLYVAVGFVLFIATLCLTLLKHPNK